jgi:hypothetical protein
LGRRCLQGVCNVLNVSVTNITNIIWRGRCAELDMELALAPLKALSPPSLPY